MYNLYNVSEQKPTKNLIAENIYILNRNYYKKINIMANFGYYLLVSWA